MFGNIGWIEIIVVGVVLLIVFGSSRLPKLVQGLGGLSKGLNNTSDDSKNSSTDKE